jgi:hypothetical protein
MREFKFRIYSFISKSFVYFDIYDYPQGIAGGVSKPQQYTGLKDIDNKEIYEGDIYYDKIYKAYCQCIWDVERLTYRWVGKNMSLRIGPRDDDMSVEVKIVGNIFEHSELLK